MPVNNRERFRRQAIESILGQTFSDFEFLIVDDASTDGTSAILAEYVARDPRVLLVETLRVIERLLGQTARIELRPPHPADVPATWADTSRTRKRLGWEPTVSLEAGMATLVRWYLEHRAWVREISTSA
jgi:glycosyltransferase involved in cell wall biosynthesis